MVKKSLTDKLRTGLYTGLAAGVLGLIGCGGGSGNTEPPAKSLSQTAVLVNSIDIDYCAKLENVSSATRTTYRNGTEIDSLTITDPNYCETLEGLTKGNYKFDLTASNVSSHSTEREVPNYNPEVDLSNLNLDMPPDSVLEVELTNPTDKNPEDNPVFYNSAESLEVNPILGGSSGQTTPLTIESYGSDLGNYQINLSFGNIGNGEGNEILDGRILDLPEKIAFWSNRPVPEGGYNEEIYSMNTDGTELQRLTTDPGQDFHPSWSPDGTQIAWATNRDRFISIYKMNNNGTNLEKVTPSINTDFLSPSWSPDGTQIGFSYIDRDLSTNGIAKINIDGSGLTKLIENQGVGTVSSGVFWSPDGKQIVYDTHRDGNWEIYTANANGNNQTNRTNNLAVDGSPSWSPDGNKILFVSYRSGSADLHLMDFDGNNIKRITDNPGIETDPKWSPDGSRIIFSHDIDLSNPQLYLMKSDGTGEWTQLTFDGSNRYPAFKPN